MNSQVYIGTRPIKRVMSMSTLPTRPKKALHSGIRHWSICGLPPPHFRKHSFSLNYSIFKAPFSFLTHQHFQTSPRRCGVKQGGGLGAVGGGRGWKREREREQLIFSL